MKNKFNYGKNFKQFISSCELDRMEQLEEELEALQEYQVCDKRESEIQSILSNAIPEEYRKILIEYNDINLSFRTMYRSFFYKQGFADSLCLTEILQKGRFDIKLDIKLV